tara:strand:+ start:45 stop:1139 length:1095 start_codon:yes stop_codon:yes gene_type:complete
MKNYLFLKHLLARLKKYIFIFLSVAIFLFIHESKSFSEENVFIIDKVIVEGKIDINFSREKYINKALTDSFEILKYRILLSKDLQKIKNLKLKDVKVLVNRFQILEETFKKDKYTGTYKIFYDDNKVKKFLSNKNISFSEPSKISAVFYPALFIDGEMKDFNGNYFYKKWNSIKIKNEVINFIMPLEDIDDILKIKEMKNKIEELNVNDLVNKYDVQNYAFALMDYNNKKLNIYLKTMFNNNKTSRNITYEIDNIDNQSSADFILKDLKLKITDIWKEENIINLSMPLTINVRFEYKKLIDLDKLKDTFYQINIIDNYSLEELNTNNSFFKIYYYGNPKRLSNELLKYGYKLKNDQGHWILHTH